MRHRMSDEVILETRNLTKEFKGFVAVNDVNLKVRRGSIHALIGPNGAGKTTVFNLLTRFLPVTAGNIFFWGKNISRGTPAPNSPRGKLRALPNSSALPPLKVPGDG